MPDPDIAGPGAPWRRRRLPCAATGGATGDAIRSAPGSITGNPTGGIFAPVKGRPLSVARVPKVPADRAMFPRNMGRKATDPKDRGTVPGEIAGREEIMAPAIMVMAMPMGAGVMGTMGREIRDPERKPASASRDPVL